MVFGDFMQFPYSDSNKRYHTLDYYYKHKYGCKVFKISLNAGFSCPHLSSGGCIYCSKTGSGEYAGNKEEDLLIQFEKGKKMMHQKWKEGKYIGYFQARTNTYAPLAVLKEKYEVIAKQPNVIGLNIATRPDSISKECLDYLEELNTRTDVTIELGLQSIHPETAKFINRGHDLQCFENMVQKLREKQLPVVIHIINGLPYETKDMMIETVKYLNTLDIQGIKIHMLSVLEDTPLADIYKKDPFKLLTQEEYIEIVCEQLQYLRPEIVIHRLTGDPCVEDLIAPHWLIKKVNVLNNIDKYMAKNDLYQGQKAKE